MNVLDVSSGMFGKNWKERTRYTNNYLQIYILFVVWAIRPGEGHFMQFSPANSEL
jgi:hypothetical protein